MARATALGYDYAKLFDEFIRKIEKNTLHFGIKYLKNTNLRKNVPVCLFAKLIHTNVSSYESSCSKMKYAKNGLNNSHLDDLLRVARGNYKPDL